MRQWITMMTLWAEEFPWAKYYYPSQILAYLCLSKELSQVDTFPYCPPDYGIAQKGWD
jgi:hypothetical protein